MKSSVAAVIFLNEKKEALFCLRDDKPDIPYPNTWGLVGGHNEENETLLETLKRETKEEIGYDIENISFIDCFDDEVGNLVYMYKAKINKKLDEIYLTEGQKLEYFSYEKIMKLTNVPKPLIYFLAKNRKKIFD